MKTTVKLCGSVVLMALLVLVVRLTAYHIAEERYKNYSAELFTQQEEVSDGEFQKAKFVRAVDGDTIVVEVDGEQAYVRMIGIDTPESVAPEDSGKVNTPEGEAASEYTKSLFKDVEVVYLQKDTSDVDKYDRLLRYVWLEVPDDKWNEEEVAAKMVNAILVCNGVAEVKTYQPDDMYEETFSQLIKEE